MTATSWVVNSGALVVGWWCWQEGYLQVADATVVGTIAQAVYLLAAVDVVMYGTHRLFHHETLYEQFHVVHHHDGADVNELSLFVMHPLEAAGFGGLLVVLLVIAPVSLPAIGIFLTINLLVGTSAHLPSTAKQNSPVLRHYQNFHGAHHADPQGNFGFFTALPDRLGRSHSTG